MGFYATESVLAKTDLSRRSSQAKPDPRPKNRVWNFHELPPVRVRRFPSQVLEPQWEAVPTASSTASDVEDWLSNDPIGISGGLNQYVFCGNDPVNNIDPAGLERKPGRTVNSRWPEQRPENIFGKKPKWNPKGYIEGKNGRRLTWDDRSHGSGVDRGNGPQGGHWDDETCTKRWNENGKELPFDFVDWMRTFSEAYNAAGEEDRLRSIRALDLYNREYGGVGPFMPEVIVPTGMVSPAPAVRMQPVLRPAFPSVFW